MALINNSQVADRTEAFEKIPRKQGLLGALGLYADRPVASDSITFDVRENTFKLLEDHKRNVAQRNSNDAQDYDIHTMAIPHYPVSGVITRQQLAGIKGFGKEAEATINNAITNELFIQGERHDITEEYLKAAMTIKGQVVTSNYGTINMATEFSVSQPTQTITNDGSAVLTELQSAMAKSKAGLSNGGRIQGYVALVDATLFASIIASADVKTAYQFSQGAGNPLRNELGTVANGYSLFRYGNVDVILYDDTFVDFDGSSVSMLTTGTGVLIPRTVLGKTIFGPASTLSGLGGVGSKRFAQTTRDPKDRYIEVDTEQNTLVINEQFGAVVALSSVAP